MVSLSTNLVGYGCLCFSFVWRGAIWCPKVASEKKQTSCFTGKQLKKIYIITNIRSSPCLTYMKKSRLFYLYRHICTRLCNKIRNCSKLVLVPFSLLFNWLKTIAPLFKPISSTFSPIVYWSHIFFGAWYQLNRKIPHICPSVFTIPRITSPINSSCKKISHNK